MGTKTVLLYRPPPRSHVSPFPQKTVPLGLMSMAATLRTRGGHNVRIVDGFEGCGAEELARLASECRADVVGITGLTAHAHDAMVAAQLVKEAHPTALVVAGGIHFSAVPEDTLRVCPHFDVVVLGEGEQTILELCDAVDGPDWQVVCVGIPGLAWMTDSGLHTTAPRAVIPDLGWLTMPAFDLVNPDNYRMRPFRYGD